MNKLDTIYISAYGKVMHQGLGTQLRHLLELLDGAVAETYAEQSLPYRPRYTPVMRALIAAEPLSISEIAEGAGITQPAATQTIGLMIRDGLVSSAPGADARQRMIHLTAAGKSLLPSLQASWRATAAAAGELDTELSSPLSKALAEAIAALEREPFQQRLRRARSSSQRGADERPPHANQPGTETPE